MRKRKNTDAMKYIKTITERKFIGNYYGGDENFRAVVVRGDNYVVNVSNILYILINISNKIEEYDSFCQVTQDDFYEVCRDNTKIDEIAMNALKNENGKSFHPFNEYAMVYGDLLRRRSEKDGAWIDIEFEMKYLSDKMKDEK